jgi:YVTN family beta-propeller protein
MKKVIQMVFPLLIMVMTAGGNSWADDVDTKVYFPLGSANAVAIVDAAQNRVVGTIPDVINAHGLAATPDGKYLVAGSLAAQPAGKMPPKPAQMSEEEDRAHHSMAGPGSQAASTKQSTDTGLLYLIDTKSRRVVHQISVPGPVHHVAITLDGRYAISTHPANNGVSVVDIKNRKLVHMVMTGPVPNYAVVNRDGKHVYVSNAGNNTVSDIDTSNWIVARNMIAGQTPEHIVLSPDERTLYVANVAAGTVSALDLKRGEVVKTFPVGPEPHGVDITDDGKELFASSKDGNKLVAIDLGSGKEKSLNLAPAPYHLAVIPGTGELYVSSRKNPLLWVVDRKSLKVKGEISIQGEGHQMAIVVNRSVQGK